MKTIQENNLIFIRLFPNEDIINSLIEVCKKYQIQTAFVLSAIGQLKHSTIGYFKEKGKYVSESFPTPHELLNLSGTIINQEDTYISHLHVVLGNDKMQAMGGHLIDGVVEVTNEIVLMTSSIPLKRRQSLQTGLSDLIIPEET